MFIYELQTILQQKMFFFCDTKRWDDGNIEEEDFDEKIMQHVNKTTFFNVPVRKVW
jgi:hypothetical protein